MIDFLARKKSAIHGTGIFTNVNIKKGLAFYLIPLDCLAKKPKFGHAHVGNNIWVSDEKVLNFVNHSCTPNSVLNIRGKPKLKATRDIRAKEEITVDYNKTEKGGISVVCNCNGHPCKKYFLRIE